MKEIYLGHQPICDPNLHVEDYQLSYHPTEGGELSEEAPLLGANAALLHHEGALGRILACTLAYEQCDWATLKESGLDAE